MGLAIISAAERLAKKHKTNVLLLAEAGLGKTTQARTLDPITTLFADAEAGTSALGDWQGDMVALRDLSVQLGCHPWELCQAFATLLCGPDPLDDQGPYGQAAYAAYQQKFAEFLPMEKLSKYLTLYVDSITVLSRWCWSWSKKQPRAFSEKKTNADGSPKPDTLGAYGVLGEEMVKFITHLQHSRFNVIFACILERKTDSLERLSWEPQIVGGMTARELPGIIDEVVTLALFSHPSHGEYRAFVTHKLNPYCFPAKDRSGCLEMLEKPDLGHLLEKIRAGVRLDGQVVTAMPAPVETTATPPQA